MTRLKCRNETIKAFLVMIIFQLMIVGIYGIFKFQEWVLSL